MDYHVEDEINVTEKFFALPAGANPLLKRIVEDLRQKNSEHPFVEQFVKKQGYPAWNFAKIKIKPHYATANFCRRRCSPPPPCLPTSGEK